MNTKKEFDSFLDALLNNTVADFYESEEGRFYAEKTLQMHDDCKSSLSPEQHEFTIDCFDLIQESRSYRETFAFRKAFSDCVSVLKWLGVIN